MRELLHRSLDLLAVRLFRDHLKAHYPDLHDFAMLYAMFGDVTGPHQSHVQFTIYFLSEWDLEKKAPISVTTSLIVSRPFHLQRRFSELFESCRSFPHGLLV